jgi:hypothetical protein
MDPEPSASEATWRADPTGRWELRWWDGQRWTDDVRRGDVVGRDPFLVGNYTQPPEAPKRNKTVLALASLAACLGLGVLLLLVALVAGGKAEPKDAAGDDDRSTTSTSSSTTTEVTTTSTTAPTTTRPSTTTATTSPPLPTTMAPPPATALPPTETPATAAMPEVVCRNLQDAQDDIQRAGVFFSSSEDATGQGRSQVVDSNWIVIRQTPPAGTLFRDNEAILYVVRTSEPNDCP